MRVPEHPTPWAKADLLPSWTGGSLPDLKGEGCGFQLYRKALRHTMLSTIGGATQKFHQIQFTISIFIS